MTQNSAENASLAEEQAAPEVVARDTGYAAPRWEFDDEVTRVFDDMLQRSIPQYQVMRQLCFEIASRYVQYKTDVVDLGCSRGEALDRLIYRFGAHNRFIGVELSEAMYKAACARFEGYINCGVVDIRNMDLRYEYPPCSASVTLSVLTLQFIPIEYRQGIVAKVYQHTRPGGAFILVEKVLGSSPAIDELMVERYYALKQANGYTLDQIQRKRLSLEGVMAPVRAEWNEDMLRAAGFSQVDVFWRWMNFCGWVALKDGA